MASPRRRESRRLDHQFAIAKLLWLREHQPDIWARGRRLCFISDFLTYWLTGKHVTEAGAAGLTGLVDIRSLRWIAPTLERIGLPADWLPEIRRAGVDLGALAPSTASELGLPVSCRFVVGCLDQYARRSRHRKHRSRARLGDHGGPCWRSCAAPTRWTSVPRRGYFKGRRFLRTVSTPCASRARRRTCLSGIAISFPIGRALNHCSNRLPKNAPTPTG